MKIIGAIAVDLEHSPIGTRSRLADELLGRPVLRRTIERVLRAESLPDVYVLCPANQAAKVRPLLEGLDVKLETHGAGPAPYHALVRASRVWGLDGWRGGVGSLCAFDEDFHAPLLDALVKRTGADAVMSIPAAAPVIDVAMLDAISRHYEENHEAARLTFVQAPPGLGAFIIHREILAELAQVGLPPGAILTYQPANPAPDATGKEACYRAPIEVIEAQGRLLCDTDRGTARVRRLLEAGGESWNAPAICNWLSTNESRRVEAVPEEIEVELTTEDAVTDACLLRPRGAAVGRRGPISMDAIHRVVDAIADDDDVRVVLGGFGDPCRHPQFDEICRILRQSNAAAIAVRTSGIDMSESVEAALFDTPIDLVEVTLDAAGPETYARINGLGAYEAVVSRLERWISRRTSQQRVLPLIVPSMVKAHETLDDLNGFVDRWQRRLGTLLVTGYSHCAGQRPNRLDFSTAPPQRDVCRRAFARTLLLADGRLTTCDQDFAGRQGVGSMATTSLRELWQDAAVLQDIRGKPCGQAPLCAKCEEWHRP
jgi:hypothetical protein